MKEGFFIGGGLIIVGLLLQLCAGPVDWDVFRWPVNGIVLAVFLALIAIIYLLRKRMYGLQFIGTYKAAIPALVYAVVLTIIMGLTPQKSLIPGSSLPTGEGSMWISYMLNFWPFVLIYVYIAVILGLIILRRAFHSPLSPLNLKRDIPFLLNHLGLFLAMTTATLGNADMQRLKMITVKGEPEWRALTPQQQIVEMPITIELKEFVMETYDDGSPRRFASDIIITPNSTLTSHPSPLTSKMEATIEVTDAMSKPAVSITTAPFLEGLTACCSTSTMGRVPPLRMQPKLFSSSVDSPPALLPGVGCPARQSCPAAER